MTASPTSRGAEAGESLERVRHLKRGTEYEVLGEAEAQISTRYESDRFGNWIGLYEGHTLVVYRCVKTGKLWCRPPEEFRDGRFETIAASPPAPVTGAERFERSLRGPGAWAFERNQRDPLLNRVGWVHCVARDRPLMPDDRVRNLRPLYYSEQIDPLIDEAAPSSQPSGGCGDVEASVEAAAQAYYDGMIGKPEAQWPHHDGWAGKSEAFKAKVRVHMARALEAASLVPASLAPDLGGGEKLTGYAEYTPVTVRSSTGASPMGTEPSPTAEPLRVSSADAASVSSRGPAAAKVRIDYTNYRGERSIRTVTPWGVEWGSTDFHPAPQWLMAGYDHEKHACRTYAIADIHAWNGVPTSAAIALAGEAGAAETEGLGPKDDHAADLSATPDVPKGGANV